MAIKLKDLPVEVGVVYEGERIRKGDMFIELGGPKVEFKAELVRARKKEEIKDEEVIVMGKDIQEFRGVHWFHSAYLLRFMERKLRGI